MVEKVITPARNIVDFARYQAERGTAKNTLLMSRMCRHCGAGLADGEREEECSGAVDIETPTRKFYVD